MNPYEWAKQHAAELTRKEKEGHREILIRYTPAQRIKKDSRQTVNIGYLFLQDIYYDLGLNKICSSIAEDHGFTYDLNAVLSRLVYTRIIFPASKLATINLSKNFLGQPEFELQHIYRGL